MPVYVYATIVEDGQEPEYFEVEQRMSDDALVRHPETGAPVRRVVCAPHIARHGQGGTPMTDDHIAKKGFAKYVNVGEGRFEKAAGSGPDFIQR
jgi:predicted nucleic acid-binding Zn ribbon protein